MRSSAVEAGRGFAHDTDRPDIHTASDEYARRFLGGGRLALLRQNACLEQLLDAMDRGPLRVLDVGGGHAQTTEAVLERGHSIVVQGSAHGCLDRVAPIARAHPDRLSGCASSMLTLPFADGSFDVVMALRLMAHVTHWRELLAEMLRVTRRYLVIDFPVRGGAQRLAGMLFRLKRRVEGNTRPFFLYNQRDVLGHLEAVGATQIAAERELVLPMVLHRIVGSPVISSYVESALGAAGLRSRWGSPVLLLAEKALAPATPHEKRIVDAPVDAPVEPTFAALDHPSGTARDGALTTTPQDR